MSRTTPQFAFMVAILAIGFLSAMDAGMKTVSLEYGALSALAWRALIAVPVVAIPYFALRQAKPSKSAMKYHMIRGAIMVPMSFFFFWGLTYVPMAQAIALAFIAPLIALLLAGLFLKETIGPRIITGSFLAFVGVLIIFFGQSQAELGRDALMGSFAILGSALLYAFNMILMRQQSQQAGPLEIAFFYFAMAGPGFWLLGALTELPAFPGSEMPALLLATAFSIIGMMGLAWAYARAGAAYLSTTEYSGFLWGALFGFLVFREVPSLWTVGGASLIVAGCWIASRIAPVDHAMETA